MTFSEDTHWRNTFSAKCVFCQCFGFFVIILANFIPTQPRRPLVMCCVEEEEGGGEEEKLLHCRNMHEVILMESYSFTALYTLLPPLHHPFPPSFFSFSTHSFFPLSPLFLSLRCNG